MRSISSYRTEILILLVIFIIYFLIRLPNLTSQPIFADEAIYIRWAQVMKSEPTLRFLPLSDGKTPLFMWIMIPLFKVFADPLFAGRVLSVISGFFTMTGVLFLGWRFFGKKIGIWGAFIYAIIPFTVFFDRMALVDSMLAAFSIWSLNAALLLIKFSRVDLAILLGYLLGGGILTKTPGFFNIVMIPATLIIFGWRSASRQRNLIKLFGLWIVAILTALALYNILRLGPGFTNLNSRNQDYVRSPLSLIERPWDPFLPHSKDFIEISSKFIGIPILILTILGIYLVLVKRNRIGITVLAWGLVPIVVQLALLQTLTARYLLFSIPALFVLAALGIQFLKSKFKGAISFILIVIFVMSWSAYFNYNLLFNIQNTPLPKNERAGYLEDWTAGYGFKEIAQYLEDKSKTEMLVVGTEGYFGTLPEGLQIYLDKNRQIAIVKGKATVSAELRQAALDHPTFFVANKSRYSVYENDLRLIMEFPKAKGQGKAQDSILFFEVLQQTPKK